MSSTRPLQLGLERALATPPKCLRDARRIGLLLNQASVDHRFRLAHDLFAAAFPDRLRALFGPQHGLWSEQQDNMIETSHHRDPRLGIPCFSLYAERREPTDAMLAEIDLLVVDLQDVGTRVYTYVWTLLLAMRACARARVPVLVLDRPNPLGGAVVEGPILDAGFDSFVGLLPIPMRHALTIGELARWFRQVDVPTVDLEVMALQGWQREGLLSDHDMPFVPTSPNLARGSAVQVYPGQVLIEGTSLSEGRGTTTPFEVCGAPGLDGYELAERMIALGADPAIALRPIRFEPTFHKFAGRSCGGVFLHPANTPHTASYRTTLALFAACRAMIPATFGWRAPPYEYEAEKMPIDILSGSAALRETIDRGADCAALDRLAEVDVDGWWRSVADSLLYPRLT